MYVRFLVAEDFVEKPEHIDLGLLRVYHIDHNKLSNHSTTLV